MLFPVTCCTHIAAIGTAIAQHTRNAVRDTTDFPTTDLTDVDWTVTVISQHRLPPMLLMTPAHRRGREPQWRMDTNFWR